CVKKLALSFSPYYLFLSSFPLPLSLSLSLSSVFYTFSIHNSNELSHSQFCSSSRRRRLLVSVLNKTYPPRSSGSAAHDRRRQGRGGCHLLQSISAGAIGPIQRRRTRGGP